MSDKTLKPLPLGTSDFETLRMRGQIYVDKTALIYEIAKKTEKFFLTRPRRFGKSLLVSTFASLFKNGLKFFSGLAIEQLWEDTTYNVVEIDFSKVRGFTDKESFEKKLRSVVTGSFERAGFSLNEEKEEHWVDQISDWMQSQPNNSLVLLVDEYDAPQTASLDNKALLDEVRRLLSSFYVIIKSNDAALRFVFMTGIAKFNQTGIFSELNNFTDISLNPAFGTLLGYSEDEIKNNFAEYLEKSANALSITQKEVLDKLRDNYDGYCFDEQATSHVYAPWSVLNFFSWPERGFDNYWVQSGGDIKALEKYLHTPTAMDPKEYGSDKAIALNALKESGESDVITDLKLVTQLGYLTIKQRELDSFYVGYPNKEVAFSFASFFARKLVKKNSLFQIGIAPIQDALVAGDINSLFAATNRTFSSIDYIDYPIHSEKTLQAFLQIFFSCTGFDVISERHNSLGRSDIEVDTDSIHWVFELKFQRLGKDPSALLEDALTQIKKKDYGAHTEKRLLKVACVFSEEKKAFVAWQEFDSDIS